MREGEGGRKGGGRYFVPGDESATVIYGERGELFESFVRRELHPRETALSAREIRRGAVRSRRFREGSRAAADPKQHSPMPLFLPLPPSVPRSRSREGGGGSGGSQADRASLISRYPHETSAQETNWISLPRHANDRIPFPRLEVVGAMHLLARSSGARSRRHSSENRITAAVERVPFPRALNANAREGEKRRGNGEEGTGTVCSVREGERGREGDRNLRNSVIAAASLTRLDLTSAP